MKETIIYAPGLNGSELLRSMALHGINTMNVRIMGSVDLARLGLMRSGIALTSNYLDSNEQLALLSEPVLSQAYFTHAGMADIQEVGRALRTARMLIPEEEEAQVLTTTLSQGLFKEKNTALCQIYLDYQKTCRERNLIDSIDLIRLAAYSCKPLSAEIRILNEYPLTPLEKCLLNTLSGGIFKEQSIRDCYQLALQPVSISEYKNCYGAPNEVEDILDSIYQNHQVDACVVAVADPTTYAQLFLDYALLYDLPVTFGTGVPILNSNPAKLLKLYGTWCQEGFFGIDALKDMLDSDTFDRKKFLTRIQLPDSMNYRQFLEFAGSLRLTNDPTVNTVRISEYQNAVHPDADRIACLTAMSRELSLPAADFIFQYTHLRKGGATNSEKFLMKLDATAASTLYNSLNILEKSGLAAEMEDMIESVLRTNICSESSREGFLHVAEITHAFSSLRDHLYLAGLSASVFPGSPKEHYLFLDADLALFPDSERLTSQGRILEKRNTLLNLVSLASSLNNQISVSFPGLNVSELKKQNASSLLLDLFRMEHGQDKLIHDLETNMLTIDYFEPAISRSREIGSAYNQEKVVLPSQARPAAISGQDAITAVPADTSWKLEKHWSPSALLQFFSCPRRFCLQYILGIPEAEKTDPFQIISPADEGTLAHQMMEKLANASYTLDEFLELSGKAYDDFLKEKPPLLTEAVPSARSQFLDMMENAYRMDPHKHVVLDEEDIYCTHESGVRLHGFPDRVEENIDGTYSIIDFKTGRHVSHQADDPDTCLQVLLYAYLMEEHFGYQVSGCEYRYFRRGETIPCRYDDEMKEELNQKLIHFRTALERGEFPLADLSDPDNDPCKYCTYGEICGKLREDQAALEGGDPE